MAKYVTMRIWFYGGCNNYTLTINIFDLGRGWEVNRTCCVSTSQMENDERSSGFVQWWYAHAPVEFSGAWIPNVSALANERKLYF